MNWPIEHFDKSEFAQWDEMDLNLLKMLDLLREHVNSSMIILCSNEMTRGHVANSQHFLGKAADVMCPGIPLLDFYLAAERFNFGGIGMYPYWTHAQYGRKGGLHLDTRHYGEEYFKGARWWQNVNKQYKELNSYTLKCLMEEEIL